MKNDNMSGRLLARAIDTGIGLLYIAFDNDAVKYRAASRYILQMRFDE